jgi:hypothetical protein
MKLIKLKILIKLKVAEKVEYRDITLYKKAYRIRYNIMTYI